LARTLPEPTYERVEAIYYASVLASLQGDVPEAAAWVHEAQAMVAEAADPAAHAFVAVADGFAAMLGGDPDRACRRLGAAVDGCGNLATRATALVLLGRAHELRGNVAEALAWNEKALALAESQGESVFRSWALLGIGIESWHKGDCHSAAELLKQGLQLAQQLGDRRTAASYLEVLAWIAAEDGKPERAVVLMGAAETVGRTVGNYVFLYPNLTVFHDECDRRAHDQIDPEAFQTAREQGRSLSFDDAVTYALAE
jgi:non-specific serine/threonine protein kinase